jgi:undecaprenyl-diphosphatase
MISYLNRIDTELFLFLNGMHNSFFDGFMYWMSDKFIWIPLYLLIAYFVIKEYKMRGLIMILTIGVIIALSDQTASGLIKNAVQRLRPSRDPMLAGLVHLSKAGAGGKYGFVSSHAANVFAVTGFLGFVLDRKFNWLKYTLVVWAILVSYSRIYNGVHYPGDVIGGALVGFFYAWVFAILYLKIERKWLMKE